MKDTYLKLTSSGSEYLMKLLEAIPVGDRDVAWNQIHADVKKASDVWKHVDAKSAHMSAIAKNIKTKINKEKFSLKRDK